MNQDESLARFKREIAGQRLPPVDVTYLGRHFTPFGGELPTKDFLEILAQGIESGTIIFDGRDFYMSRYVGAFKVSAPVLPWTLDEILGARCFDGGVRERTLEEMKATPQAPTASPSPTIARPISRTRASV